MGKFAKTQLGLELIDALKSRDEVALASAVQEVKDACRDRSLEAGSVTEAVELLRDHRKFIMVLEVGDIAMTAGLAQPESRKLYCQAATDLGLLRTAEMELKRLLEEQLSATERGEVLGLLGRNFKQRFVDDGPKSTYSGDHMREAIRYYELAYDARTDPAWHGANLVALLARSERDKIALGELRRDVEPLARDILAIATEKIEKLRNVWMRNTEVEVLLALGRKDEAQSVAEKLAQAINANPFELGSLRRQLIEVWELDPSDPLLAAIDNNSLDLGAGAALDVPEGQFEKYFGNVPVGYKTYHRGLEVARFVAMVTDRNGEGWGTGFLVPGYALHDGLGDEPLFVTNYHVVSTRTGIAKLGPRDARASFEALKDGDGGHVQLEFDDEDELFTSDPDLLDCTILEVRKPLPKLEKPIGLASRMPVVEKGAYVYVIGHPMRGGLSLSIRGNDLLDVNEDKARLQYRAPTEKGSSGSPVFDDSWNLIGLHHYGSEKLRKLDGSGARYEANQGVSIHAIRSEFMQEYKP